MKQTKHLWFWCISIGESLWHASACSAEAVADGREFSNPSAGDGLEISQGMLRSLREPPGF
jgi:hypothetical protein